VSSITIDRDAARPLYQQIAGQFRQQIREGRLPIGAKLPAIRRLAESLGVTRLTVQTAYDELRAEGWIETAVGRGTFVARSAQPTALMDSVGQSLTPRGVLDDQPRIEQIPIVRSFAYAEPDPALAPWGTFWHAMNRLRPQGADLFRYNPPQGDASLRSALADLLRERGIEAMPDDVLVTAGVTQGISLVVQALTRPGDFVAVEEPTHLGLLSALRAFGVEPIGIRRDRRGPRLDDLERVIAQVRPRFFHVSANFRRPTGESMSSERRSDLLRLARSAGIVLIEDDGSGLLAYDDGAPPALKAQDEDDLVIYLSGMSKVMMPGLRIGYTVAPRPLHDRLIELRRAVDFCGVPFIQQALAIFLKEGELKRHLRRIIPVYRTRRDRLLAELSAQMPPGTSWSHPGGGFTCWLTLPPGVDAGDVHRETLRRGFAFTPGDAFLTQPGPPDHLRICFAGQREGIIAEAMVVLGQVIREQMDQPALNGADFAAPI
jgi:DNA-binding transcriptional MocR family regulator